MSRNALHHAELLEGLANQRPAAADAQDHVDRAAPLLSHRLAWRLGEWGELTNTSRATILRQIRNGDLRIVRIGTVKMVPRAEAIRLGMIAA